jgi:hypothetical protein
LALRLSLLPYPGSHASVHVPLLHARTPLAWPHTLPHVPQFSTSEAVGVSQPSDTKLLQLPQPGTHPAMVHEPPEQPAAAFARVHTVGQAPQCSGSALRSTSHPLFALPSQLANPELHVGVQRPLAHAVVPLGLLQEMPQAPQCKTVLIGASHPFAALASQSPKPASHDPIEQVPVVQDSEAFGTLHTEPQAPQLVSEVRGVSHPLLTFPSHEPHPAEQVGAQAPEVQAVAP